MMNHKLDEIFILESENKYDEAFLLYKSFLKLNPLNFEVWKHYFFFLWSMIEDINGDFTIIKNENLNVELNKELQFGLEKFENIAEFNFIAGYTISIFPYEFGDYEEFEKIGLELLNKAFKLDPQNQLYEMVYLGSLENTSILQKKRYKDLEPNVCKTILEQNSKKGILNEYYQQVFIRK